MSFFDCIQNVMFIFVFLKNLENVNRFERSNVLKYM